MTNESSLVLFERGAVLLSQATTLQKAKELKDLSLTAAEWARRKGAGEDAIQYCRAYALEAERKIGEMLAETERARGAAAPKSNAVHPGNRVETLAELGITKKESANAQKLAALPVETFQEVKAGKKSRAKAIAETKSAKPKPKREPEPQPEDEPDFQAELAAAQKEIEGQEKLIESLMKNDLQKELVIQRGRFDALNGRLHQVLTTEAEARRTAKYRGDILTAIRKVLGVEKDSEILPAIKALQK